MAISSATAVLGVPELRSAIFGHLDRYALFSTVRVCRAWAASGLGLLWSDIDDHALMKDPKYGGFDYDGAVRRLTIGDPRMPSLFPGARALASHQLLDQWMLPRLQYLRLSAAFVQACLPQALCLLARCNRH
jgi:hypothetical protein